MKVGDYVQWTSQGVDQFEKPKQIRSLSPEGDYAFFADSKTGVPVEQLRPVRVNPIVDFNAEDLIVWGKKTLKRRDPKVEVWSLTRRERIAKDLQDVLENGFPGLAEKFVEARKKLDEKADKKDDRTDN